MAHEVLVIDEFGIWPYDREAVTARNLRKLALGAVSADVPLLDGKALARCLPAGETGPVDGRTKQSLTIGYDLDYPEI